MKRFSWFVVMAALAALTVPALLTGCNSGGVLSGEDEDEPKPGGGNASILDVGEITITEESGWSYSEGVYIIDDGANVIVTGETNTNRVVVAPDATATVTLSGVEIDVSGMSDAPAFDVSGANVTVLLSGTNTLKSGSNLAGLHAPAGSTLTITSKYGDGSTRGTLNATGGHLGAGIGGGNSGSGGTITISGGTVNATGGYGAAGIGGGCNGSGGNITISDGFVTALSTGGSGDPAAIGGGGYGNAGTIAITGGCVVALNYAGSGIDGGLSDGPNGSISISGGTVIVARRGIGIQANSEVTITNASVFAPAINNHISNPGNGIAIGTTDADGNVIDDVNIHMGNHTITLNANFTIPNGATLTVPTGWTLKKNGKSLSGAHTGSVID
jgi:hypothetical protein